jgi:hypothetical protein
MKTTIAYSLLAGIFAASLLAQQTEVPQSLISTGSVVSVSNQDGSLTLRVEQSGKPLLFSNMDKAPVFYADGRRATFAEIRLGEHATVYYAQAQRGWVVGKVVISNPSPPVPAVGQATPSALTRAEQKALQSKAANDGDITTKPGVKARIDNDITTKPGEKDPAERDITRKPAR